MNMSEIPRLASTSTAAPRGAGRRGAGLRSLCTYLSDGSRAQCGHNIEDNAVVCVSSRVSQWPAEGGEVEDVEEILECRVNNPQQKEDVVFSASPGSNDEGSAGLL